VVRLRLRRGLVAVRRPPLTAHRIASFAESAPPEVREDVASVVPFLETWLIFRDGREHGRVRRALHEGFNASAIAALREPIERVARDDFLGLMARAVRTAELTDQEAIGSTMLLLIAGHLPVRNLIGNVVWLLGRHRTTTSACSRGAGDDRRRDRGDAALRATDLGVPRITMENVSVGGQRIPAGEVIQLSDPRRQPRPGSVPGPGPLRDHPQAARGAQLRPWTPWLPRRSVGPRAGADRARGSVSPHRTSALAGR
jgi:cytochrome P450